MATRKKPAEGVVHPRAIRARLLAVQRNVEGCLHPDAPAGCNGIIDAHSLQRRGPLLHLKDETNHVFTFWPGSNAFFESDPDSVGWNEASTFRGLCQFHDQIFRPIEEFPFASSEEQVFLVGYRGVYLECHQKRAAIAACERIGYAELARMYAGEQLPVTEARRVLRLQQAGRRKGLQELQGMKVTYDRAWRTADFRELSSCVVAFEGSLSVASAGVVSPDYLVGGDRLQELHLPGMQSLAFGSIATERGGAIVFTWPREMTLMKRFVESLTSLPSGDLPGALLLFMFSYVSNTFFRAAWWHGLRSTARVRLSQAGRTPQQYYTPVNYRIGSVVDWTITGVEFK